MRRVTHRKAPRWRGPVDLIPRPPHPNPLPAGGKRVKVRRALTAPHRPGKSAGALQGPRMSRIVVIDNYDSFTWNLVHLIGPLVERIRVVRNDETTPQALLGEAPDAIVLSPGPCTPNEAGICLDLIREAGPKIPIFGVCLGMQAIGQAFGGEVVRAALPM